MDRGEKRKIRYKKIGGGSLRFGGKIYKPNQEFEAYPEDIPEGFHDVIIPLEKVPEVEDEKPLDVIETGYELVSRGVGGWFDIVNTVTGKKVNDKALKKDKAEEFLQRLEGKDKK